MMHSSAYVGVEGSNLACIVSRSPPVPVISCSLYSPINKGGKTDVLGWFKVNERSSEMTKL